MSEPRVIALELDYEEWTVDELHDYRGAVSVNAPFAAAKIEEAKAADFADLFTRMADDGGKLGDTFTPPPDWQPLHILAIDPEWMLGFAWIPARRADPALEWKAFCIEVKAGQLLEAFADAVFALAPDVEEEPDDDAPLATDSAPETTTPPSKTKPSSVTPTSGRSQKSADSQSGSTPK